MQLRPVCLIAATLLAFGCPDDRPDAGLLTRDLGVAADATAQRDADAPDVLSADTGMPRDSGESRDTGEPPDAGELNHDAEPPDATEDAGTKDECTIDQDCSSGQVCRLDMSPRTCVAGHACVIDNDCTACSSFTNPMIDCGHGAPLTATCDANHGNVCVRGRAECEACTADADCGRIHPILGGAAKRCISYPNGGSFCGRACGSCPDGFVCDAATQACIRPDGCDPVPVLCDFVGGPNPRCQATEQICPGDMCTAGGLCSTNNIPGELGVCIGYCVDNADCAPPTPVCNVRNGICVAGCIAMSCAGGLVCHNDGFCRAPCINDMDCDSTEYCNQVGRPEPRAYKNYRDEFSCAPLGCERASDCPSAVCDTTTMPPSCAP